MRPENLDKLIMKEMWKHKRNKIEKIDEEDEANSSMMQSEDSESKKQEELTPTNLERMNSQDSSNVNDKKYNEATQRILVNKHDHPYDDLNEQLRTRSKSNSMAQQVTPDTQKLNKLIKAHPQTEPSEPLFMDKSQEIKKERKQTSSNKKVDNTNSYKVNSVSLLNMLQNKTTSLIKNVK